jgi:hypothetical protein
MNVQDRLLGHAAFGDDVPVRSVDWPAVSGSKPVGGATKVVTTPPLGNFTEVRVDAPRAFPGGTR